jgi:hypothetical protein
MYSENEKKQMKNALMEAKKTLAALKIDQADKLDKPKTINEGISHTCGECGGTGMVEKPLPEATKTKVEKYNRQAKAFHAASKRLDANHNGIPDDEEFEEEVSNNPFAKKSATKKPAAKTDDSKGGNPFAKKSAKKDDSKTESMFGGSVYGESVTPVKKPSGIADKKGGNPFAKKDDAKNSGGKEFGKALDKARADVQESAKKAKKDYDKDGKIETGKEEHKGSVDNAIKASKEKECMNESVELSRLREITSRVIR